MALKTAPTGLRGLFYSSSVAQDLVLAEIPKSIALTPDTLSVSAIGEMIAHIRSKAKLTDTTAMAMFVLHEKLLGEQSFWHPYMKVRWRYSGGRLLLVTLPRARQVLPREVGLPIEWGDTALKSLHTYDVPFYQHLESSYTKYVHQLFHALKSVTFDTPEGRRLWPAEAVELKRGFHWAYAMVLSRGYGLESVSLLPLLDMANHMPAAAGFLATGQSLDGKLLDVSKGAVKGGAYDAFQLKANFALPDGEELITSYDNTTKCHLDMLAMYGFTDRDARRDCFHLSLGVDMTAADWRYDAFQTLGRGDTRSFTIQDSGGAPPQGLLALLRLMVLELPGSMEIQELEKKVRSCSTMLICCATTESSCCQSRKLMNVSPPQTRSLWAALPACETSWPPYAPCKATSNTACRGQTSTARREC